MESTSLTTDRLTLRPWRPEDAEPAWAVYGAADVARWLAPAMHQVPDVPAMRSVLEAWAAEADRLPPPLGRWAVTLTASGEVVGGVALLSLPPDGEDVEIAWQVAPAHQRNGYATEASRALLDHAFTQSLDEVLAVSRPGNKAGGSVIRRLGMEWVGTTEKYYGLELDVHRLRPADLRHG